MVQYLLETLAFQLVFLWAYDLFLKKETFFQWNRAYLLGTFVLSLVLPWVKLEVFKTTVSQEFATYPAFLWQMDTVTVTPEKETSFWQLLTWQQWIFAMGAFLMTVWFCIKLIRIHRMKKKGNISRYPRFTKVVVPRSELAFSFFKNVFLGDGIKKEKEAQIVAHELVHIEQWHSLDLLFLELMRIVFWVNPMVYIYQKRIAELHEFIADAQVVKTNTREYYQSLLSQCFGTNGISFINPFYKSSLIKKRIVMLTKKKSKSVYQFKYLLLLPLLVGIFFYTSCETEEGGAKDSQVKSQAEVLNVPFATVEEAPIFPGCENASDKRTCFNEMIQKHIAKNFKYPEEAQEYGIQGRVSVMCTIDAEGNIVNIRKRGPHELLENETVRIISKLPQMKPGKQGGKAVNVPFSIPVTFKLMDSSDEVDASRAAKGSMQVGGALTTENGTTYYKGRVVDEVSMGLPGVNISVEGTAHGVVSDFDGNFSIKAKEGETLKFEYNGLPTKRVKTSR